MGPGTGTPPPFQPSPQLTSSTSFDHKSSSGAGSTRLWQIISGVLAIALVAAVIITATNADNGSQWKKRANTAESLAHQMQTKLAASEAASKDLKARTITLANEKAQAEDDRTITKINQKIASGISTKLDSCTADLQDLFSKIAAATSVDQLNQIANTTAEDAYRSCDAASRAAEGFSQYLQNQGNS